MEVPVKRTLDLIDAERIADMMKSEPFRVYQSRIQAELERARGTCETSDVTAEFHRAQGASKALRTVLALPAQILAEIKRQP